MRLNAWLRVSLIAGVAVSLSGCSYIASLFPDKQKQYRYSSELPDLEIPPDLKTTAIEKKGEEGRAQSRYEASERPSVAREETRPRTETPEPRRSSEKSRKPAKSAHSGAALAESGDNAAMIEIEESFPEAWNDVNRALGRLQIEINDQNRSDGVYYVYYGGESPKKREEKKGIWNDFTSLFTGEEDLAKEFHLKLEERGDLTHIKVFDQDDKPVTSGLGLDLLKRLHEKLQHLDQPEPEAEESKREHEPRNK